MNRLFKLDWDLVKVVRPVVDHMCSVPLPQDDYFRNLQDLFDKLEGINQVLTDSQVTTVSLVTNPEKIVIKETQ